MMRSKGVILVIVGMLLSQILVAQEVETLVFSEKTFDFGAVKEEGGPVIHQFNFVNKGLEPIKILNVNASCGCTTPDWTKTAVKPGEAGYIQAQYNPRNRPGSFHKSLTVTTDASSTPIRLYIRGKVVPKPESFEALLPTKIGGLRVKYRSFNMGKVYTSDEPAVKTFDVYNDSDTLITFLETQEAPAHIRLEFEPQTLEPAARGLIKVTYDAKRKNEFGFSSDNVKFFTSERGENATKSISVYATIEEYFPPMTYEELEKAPKLHLGQIVHDFGRIEQNDVVSTIFTLTNKGINPLNVRQVKSNCSCTTASLKKDTLQPGESTEMQVTFNAEGRRGNQQKSVTIFSNDPKASAQRVTIKAYVTGD